MAGIKIRINSEGVLAVLNDPAIAADMHRRASAVQNELPTSNGEEWRLIDLQGDRPSSMVRAENYEARLAAAKDLALQRALGRAHD